MLWCIFGWAIGQTKDVAQGVQCLEEALAGFNRLGLRSDLCLPICLLAETYFTGGRYESAMDQVNQAITTSSEIGDRWCLPLIYMTHARLLQQTYPKADTAEASLRRALEVAELQCAKGWELRAAMSMARLWCDRGKRMKPAIYSLRPTAGSPKASPPATSKDAKALLEQLTS